MSCCVGNRIEVGSAFEQLVEVGAVQIFQNDRVRTRLLAAIREHRMRGGACNPTAGYAAERIHRVG